MEPLSRQEFNDLVFELRDRLWEGDPPTEPEPPLRLAGWRGRAHEVLSELLDMVVTRTRDA